MAEELLETLARAVIDRRAEYDKTYKAKAKAEKAKKAAEADLNEAMAKAKLPGATLDLGPGYGRVQFNREQKVSSSVFDKDAAIAYFDEHGMSQGYVEGNVRKAPLNQLIRDRMEAGQELPPGIEPRITKYVKVTKRNK